MTKNLLNLEPERRDAILNAALKEFASEGFDNASTNRIAKDAGISKALMFHYVHSKQELFLLVYDYFSELLNREYYEKMDFSETDIFDRLRCSYLLQIDLLKQYPWILEFGKLSLPSDSDEIDKALKNRAATNHAVCSRQILDGIDTSQFRPGLDTQKSIQFILWINTGFTDQILNEIRNPEAGDPDYERIILTLDRYFQELKKTFYRSERERECEVENGQIPG